MIDKIACHADEVTELTRLRQEVESLRSERQQRSNALHAAGHELRNPLTAILGFTELMLENEHLTPEQQQRFLRTILQKSMLLKLGVEDLQSIARLDGNRPFEIRPQDCDIRTLLEDVCEQFRLEHPDYSFELHEDARPLNGLFDQRRISQVLHNLLSNAVKYSLPGSRIVLQAGNVQGMLRVSVRDQGCGMTTSETKQAFVRYFRSARHARQIEGQGLGLTICQAIIQAHGGTISLQSHPGKGTIASFTLPAADDGLQLQPHQAPVLESPPRTIGARIH